MTTLSTEDNTFQGTDDRDPDGINPVIEVMGKSWQRLLARSEWQPQQLPFRVLPQEQAYTLPRGLRGEGRICTHQARPAGEGTMERCTMCEREQGIFSRLG